MSELADSGQQYGGYAYRDATAMAHTERVPIVYPRAGPVWHTDDGVTLTFIGPSLPFIENDNTINDNSIAFILQYKHFRMLFTGDDGFAAEQRFLSEGIELRAGVLKVGHHGSAYSSSSRFIAAVHPATQSSPLAATTSSAIRFHQRLKRSRTFACACTVRMKTELPAS